MKISRKQLSELIYEAMNNDISELSVSGNVDIKFHSDPEEDSEDSWEDYDDNDDDFVDPSIVDNLYKLPMIDDGFEDEKVEDDFEFIEEVVEEKQEELVAEESLSRGALYRNRYDGRY